MKLDRLKGYCDGLIDVNIYSVGNFLLPHSLYNSVSCLSRDFSMIGFPQTSLCTDFTFLIFNGNSLKLPAFPAILFFYFFMCKRLKKLIF